MFDFAWTEIALIGVVALIAIGPKDLPIAIKTIAGFMKKARRMAGEFQGHVDEMVREANLGEVRDQISQLRNFDIKGEIEKAVDSDGSLRSSLNQNPMQPDYVAPSVSEQIVEQYKAHNMLMTPPPLEAPSFIPPTADIIAPLPTPAPEPVVVVQAPSFIPPGTEPAAPSAG